LKTKTWVTTNRKLDATGVRYMYESISQNHTVLSVLTSLFCGVKYMLGLM